MPWFQYGSVKMLVESCVMCTAKTGKPQQSNVEQRLPDLVHVAKMLQMRLVHYHLEHNSTYSKFTNYSMKLNVFIVLVFSINVALF